MSEQAKCDLCGEPMPPGEEMFKFHGYSGDCPKPPLPRPVIGHVDPWGFIKELAQADMSETMCAPNAAWAKRRANELLKQRQDAARQT